MAVLDIWLEVELFAAEIKDTINFRTAGSLSGFSHEPSEGR